MLLDLLPLFDEPTGGGGLTRLRHAPVPQRKVLPGAGHLHIRLELHGEPGATVTTTGTVRSTIPTSAPVTVTTRLVSTTPLLHARTTVTARNTVTCAVTTRAHTPSRHQVTLTTRGQLHDTADLWLLLDMPELT